MPEQAHCYSATPASGVRVIEIVGAGSGIAAAYAGWLLARMGAEVTRVVAPDILHASPKIDPDPLQLAAEVLADGKLTLEMPHTQADFAAMAKFDLEAAKKILMEKNNAGELNINQLVVIGAGPIGYQLVVLSAGGMVARAKVPPTLLRLPAAS